MEEEEEEEEALKTVGVEEDKKVKRGGGVTPPPCNFGVIRRMDMNGLNKKLHRSSPLLDTTNCRKSEWRCFQNRSNRSHKYSNESQSCDVSRSRVEE
jgi:hypothetical protein